MNSLPYGIMHKTQSQIITRMQALAAAPATILQESIAADTGTSMPPHIRTVRLQLPL